MSKEIANSDASNGDNSIQDLEGLDATALTELITKEREANVDTLDKNKQLFERAKTAEGFEKQEDGSWVKKEEKDKESKDEKTEKKSETKTKGEPDNDLLNKTFLRAAGIKDEDEVELALKTAEKWNVTVDKLVDDEDFKVKLEKLRDTKATADATSNVKGSGGKSTDAKNTPEYWISKGTPPSKEDIPDSKVRRKISRAFFEANKPSGKLEFYNSRKGE